MVREDDYCKPEDGIAAVKKLIYEDKVFAIIGGGCSNATLAARPEIVKAGIHSSYSAVADGISTPVAQHLHHAAHSLDREPRAGEVRPRQKAKKLAVVAQKDAWGRARYEP